MKWIKVKNLKEQVGDHNLWLVLTIEKIIHFGYFVITDSYEKFYLFRNKDTIEIDEIEYIYPVTYPE